MRRIHYVDAAVTTGDAVAAAVLSYARELARAGTADTVDIPVLLDAGGFGRAQLLVGPASQLVVTEADPDQEGVVDPAVVADLDGRRHLLASRRTAVSPRPGGDGVPLDFEG